MDSPEPIKPPKRRWRQFSISTLLVVVTVLSVALGVVTNRAERQRRAVAAIRESGGTVLYDFERKTPADSPGPDWLRRILGVDYCADVVYVRLLDNMQLTDASLVHVAGLTNLQELHLGNSLQVMPLVDAQVTDAGLAHLAGLTSLQSLWLNGTEVTDAGVAHLAGLKSLDWVWLNRTRVTEEACNKLRHALPNCSVTRFEPLPARVSRVRWDAASGYQ